MNAITLINLEWNAWNGFVFQVLAIETRLKDSRSLLAINTANSFFIIDILFIQFTLFDKNKL